MKQTLTMLTIAALAAAPLVMAHDPAGTYKNYCESPAEWDTHDYGGPATGMLLNGYEDGNLGGDCDNSGLGFTLGSPCAGFDDPADLLTFYAGLCDSQLDLPAADWDGHAEYARGGAWILVESGDGTYRAYGSGTLYCFGDEGHHLAFGPFSVQDVALGAGATFTVAADVVDTVGEIDPSQASGCGDFESDQGTDCVGSCSVTFPPGLDGSYQVYVQGTQGHVYSDGSFSVGASSCTVNGPGADCKHGSCRVNLSGQCKGNCTVNSGTCSKGCAVAVNLDKC